MVYKYRLILLIQVQGISYVLVECKLVMPLACLLKTLGAALSVWTVHAVGRQKL